MVTYVVICLLTLMWQDLFLQTDGLGLLIAGKNHCCWSRREAKGLIWFKNANIWSCLKSMKTYYCRVTFCQNQPRVEQKRKSNGKTHFPVLKNVQMWWWWGVNYTLFRMGIFSFIYLFPLKNFTKYISKRKQNLQRRMREISHIAEIFMAWLT